MELYHNRLNIFIKSLEKNVIITIKNKENETYVLFNYFYNNSKLELWEELENINLDEKKKQISFYILQYYQNDVFNLNYFDKYFSNIEKNFKSIRLNN